MVAPLAMIGLSLGANLVKGIAGQVSSAVSGPMPSADATRSTAGDATAQTRKTAKDFEKMFLEQTLDRLAEGGGEDGPLGANGEGGGVYRSMLMKEYAGKVQESGGLGIADQVYRQMLKMQEAAHG